MNTKVVSATLVGRFRTPSDKPHDLVFAFSGDEAGQGWGIDESWGGYRVYEAMRKFEPDFFIHSGDQIYADGPIQSEVKLDDGSLWKNVVSAEKSKVAETLAEYRGAFAYNLLDKHKRRFCAEVPMLVQWDDHETRNNWYPGQRNVEADRERHATVDRRDRFESGMRLEGVVLEWLEGNRTSSFYGQPGGVRKWR